MFKKIGKCLLSTSLVLASVLAVAGCGKDDEDNNKKELIESLSWVEEINDLRGVFKAAKSNYTLTAKNISSFTMEEIPGDYDWETFYRPINVTYANDEMYKIYVENDAVYLDAGDKKDSNGKYLSTASELALDNGILKHYTYTKTDTDWEKTETEQQTYTGVNALKASNDVEKEKVISDVFFGGVFNGIYDQLGDVMYEKNFDKYSAGLAELYDSNSQSFVINRKFNEADRISTNNQYKGLEENRYVKYYSNDGYPYYISNEYDDTYEKGFFVTLYYYNVSFKLENQKLTSLSYDVYMSGKVDENGRQDYRWDKGEVGLHVEITNIGSTVMNLNSDVQASRANYSGVEASDVILETTKTFYNKGNYTVRYEGSFVRKNQFNDEPEYILELKVMGTTVSYYSKYYDYAQGVTTEKRWIQTIHDDTHTATYNYDYSTEKWYKDIGGIAEGTTAEEQMLAYKTYYWNCMESNLHGGSLDISSQGLNDEVTYSDTLKSYIIKGGAKSSYVLDSSELHMTKPIDAIYTFSETGLEYLMSRHAVEYYPAEYSHPNMYAKGMLTKTIFDIGETAIEIPTDNVIEVD